jgi:peptidoglycan DL-endopeptidase CwlO
MTYVDGLSATLDNISEIQQTFASMPTANNAGGFEAVMAQISALGGASAAQSPTAGSSATSSTSQAPSGYGWPLEESTMLPGASTDAGSPSPQPVANAPSDLFSPSIVSTASSGSSGSTASSGPSGPSTTQSLGEQAVSEAEKFLGVPYVWGGTNPAIGVDCSGLVQDVYGPIGISLPRTSEEQATVGEDVPSLAEAQPGDLVFFPGSDGTATSPGHVGIYIGNGEMIDAPHTGTQVRIDAVGDPTQIRRVTGVPTSNIYAGLQQPQSASTPTSTGTAWAEGTGSALYNADFASASSMYGVPEQLLSAVAQTESDYQSNAVSNAGAEGLMQLMPSTASSLGADPWDPTQAVPAAAKLLSSYHNQYGSWSLALAAYNAGPGAVDEYSGIPPYPQTQAYVQTVLSRAGMEGS